MSIQSVQVLEQQLRAAEEKASRLEAFTRDLAEAAGLNRDVDRDELIRGVEALHEAIRLPEHGERWIVITTATGRAFVGVAVLSRLHALHDVLHFRVWTAEGKLEAAVLHVAGGFIRMPDDKGIRETLQKLQLPTPPHLQEAKVDAKPEPAPASADTQA